MRIVGRQVIEVDRYSLRVTKSGLLSKKVYDIDIDDIDSIGMQKGNMSSMFKSAKFNNNGNNPKNYQRLEWG
ncbi:MAG: hypothetical protein HC803_03865 [Saprospiraceae bacterium]|nr:hypothetical protein [Saprospiraceae bacterium]